MRVAYIMSKFPTLTETFIAREILAMERAGLLIGIYPLRRQRAGGLRQPEADSVKGSIYDVPLVSPRILLSQLILLGTRPARYLGALVALLHATWPSLNFVLGALAVFPKAAHLARLLESNGTEHVHCHFANHPTSAGFVIWRLTGIPYSFTAHGSDIHRDRRGLGLKVAEAKFVVAISEFNRRVIIEECGEAVANRVHVIHCGVDPEQFPYRIRNSSAGRLRILCVGKLHEVKGQRFLLDACRLLVSQGVAFQCHMVGDGPDRRALETRIHQYGLQKEVRLEGAKSSSDIARLLQRATALVAPSVPSSDGRKEGIPVALMEAMSSGVPVIASRLSGIPELVEEGETGLLVTPGDSVGIARALMSIRDDTAMARRLAIAGRKKIEDQFDVNRNAAELARRFRSVADDVSG